MVDAEDLFFMRIPRQFGVQLSRRPEVVAERFLHDDALLGIARFALVQQTGVVQLLHDLAELARGCGEIKQKVAAQFLVREGGQLVREFLVGSRLGDVPLAIGNIGGELRPDRVLDRLGPGKLLKRGAQFLSPGVVSFFPAGKTDDAEPRGQLFLAVEMVERRNQLARGQVPAGAKNDDGARLDRLSTEFEATAQQLIQILLWFHRRKTMADAPPTCNQSSRAWNKFPSREQMKASRGHGPLLIQSAAGLLPAEPANGTLAARCATIAACFLSAASLRSSAPLPFPPKHQFQSGPIRIGPRHPFRQKLEMWRKPLHYVLARRAYRRPVCVGNQVVHREVISGRVQPAQYRFGVIVAVARIDRAKQCVLEDTVKEKRRGVPEKIAQLESGRQSGLRGPCPSELGRRRRNVVADRVKAPFSPRPNVMACATARHTHRSAFQFGMRRQKIDEAW